MLKPHVVSLEVVALCCVIGSGNILVEHPYTDNTDTVLLYYCTRLQGAVPCHIQHDRNITFMLFDFFFHRKIVIFYFSVFLVQYDGYLHLSCLQNLSKHCFIFSL